MVRTQLAYCLLALAVTGCAAPSPPGGTYSRRDVQRAWTVEQGTVADITEVAIEGRTTGIGQVGGGAIGWAVGREAGHGGGRVLASVVGGVAGAVVGEQIEKSARQRKGFEIVLDLDKGGSIAVIQPADQTFAEGERVRVYTRRDGSARVAKL